MAKSQRVLIIPLSCDRQKHWLKAHMIRESVLLSQFGEISCLQFADFIFSFSDYLCVILSLTLILNGCG